MKAKVVSSSSLSLWIGGALLAAVVGAGATRAADAGTPPAAGADGQGLWNDKRAKCATCHGADGKGDTKMGKQKGTKDMTTAEWQKSVTDQQILDAILKGIDRTEGDKKVKMEPLKEGTDAEAKALMAVVRGFAPK